MKKVMRYLSALLTAAALSCVVALSAAAASFTEWQVYSENGASTGWTGNGSTLFSVDKSVRPTGSSYSLRLENTDYNISYIEKAFNVQPNTSYRFSAKVKYSGYSLDPEAEDDKSGACVGLAFSYDHSEFTTDSEWTTVEYFFDSGDRTSVNLCLQNGIYNAKCHGTAWFADVRLEKQELTNNWKVLTIIFKEINAKDASSDNDWVMSSLSDEAVERVKTIIKGISTSKSHPNSFNKLSGGLINVKESDMKFVVETEPLRELAEYYYAGDTWGTGEIRGNMFDCSSELAESLIEKYSGGKTYNQVIFVLPLGNKEGWAGLGSAYGIQGRCQINFTDDDETKGTFPEGTVVHEILHNMEHRSMVINESTPRLHSSPDFGYDTSTDNGAREYYSLYLKKALKGGKGLDPAVFTVPSGKYTLISDNMTAGKGISSETLAKDISELSCGTAKATYTGKPLKPDIPLTEAGYTLKKGVDYTVTYRNNTNIGTAFADVKGIGAYCGSRTVEFKITPALGSVSMKLSGSKLSVSWGKVSGASYYELWQLVDGKFKKIKEKTTALSAKVDFKKDVTYQFAVAAFIPEINSLTEYVYTKPFRVDSKPQTVSVSRSGSTLTVSWSEVEGAKYTVMKSVDGGEYKTVVKNTDAMSAKVSVKAGHTYKFKVKAYIPTVKYSTAYVATKSVKISDAVPKVTIKKSTNKITLSWNKVGNSKTYDIWQSVDGGKYSLIKKDVSALTASFIVPDGHKYNFAVSAYDPTLKYSTGYGYSSAANIAPIAPKVTVRKDGNKIVVSWTKVNGATYDVWQEVSGGSFTKVISDTDKVTAEITGKKGKSYCFAVIGYVEETHDYTEYGYSQWITL